MHLAVTKGVTAVEITVDGAPIEQLMASVFSELRLTEVSGGVEPSAAAGFFSRKGLERIGQLRKVRANGRLGAHLASLAQQLLKRAPLDSEAAQALVEALKVEVDRQLDMIAGSGGGEKDSAADALVKQRSSVQRAQRSEPMYVLTRKCRPGKKYFLQKIAIF